MPPRSTTTSTLLVRTRSQTQRAARRTILRVLTRSAPPKPADPLTQLANTFTRYAQTQPTVYDTSTSATPAVAGASLLERQVDRALTQVLGRGVGRGSSSFMAALDGAFPSGADGQVQFTPSRGAVSMYVPKANGNGYSQAQLAGGLVGQLSAEQATLYRQASVVAADALNTLAGLQPFVPDAETDKVEALRALVRAEVQTLVEEFGRADEPRDDRVESYLDALDGPQGSLKEFGRKCFLDRRIPAVSPDDEAMIAGFDLLTSYVSILRKVWVDYSGAQNGGRSLAFPEFTLRLQRASVMLSVLSDANNTFMLAMDSVGYTERERRSQAAKLTTLAANPDIRLGLPDITIGDMTDEFERLASVDGPAYLADSGQYGLDLLTKQAHRLFMLISPIVGALPATAVTNLNGLAPLGQILTHERVNWALDDLHQQFHILAELAA